VGKSSFGQKNNNWANWVFPTVLLQFAHDRGKHGYIQAIEL
jgi:hypothetical protein